MAHQATGLSNSGLLLELLNREALPHSQIRELTQNSLEAVKRAQESGLIEHGVVIWDVDWHHLEREGIYCLSVVDNGDGMIGDHLTEYLNNVAVEGASQNHSIDGNFGIGAKITAQVENPDGVLYRSWVDGIGNAILLRYNRKTSEYGIQSMTDSAGEPKFVMPIPDILKPATIENHGTIVTLLGGRDGRVNTMVCPHDLSGGIRWLSKQLNSRYFTFPDSVSVKVREFSSTDIDSWPIEPPRSISRGGHLRTVMGMKSILDSGSEASGCLELDTVRLHWWIMPSSGLQAIHDQSGLPSSHVAALFDSELYEKRTQNSARKIIQSAGLVFSHPRVTFYFEPRNAKANAARSALLIDGLGIDEGNHWERWLCELQSAGLPDELDELEAEAIKDKPSDNPDIWKRQVKRLEKAGILTPSRYRRSKNGKLQADGESVGGEKKRENKPGSKPNPNPKPRPNGNHGRGGLDYLSHLIDGGESSSPIKPKIPYPRVEWITERNGTRPAGDLEDYAAEIVGDPIGGDIILANLDFRGFTDIVDALGKQWPTAETSAVRLVIEEAIQEWLGQQLIEVVVATRNLQSGLWTRERIAAALTPEALTAVALARTNSIENVKRAVGTKIGAAKR